MLFRHKPSRLNQEETFCNNGSRIAKIFGSTSLNVQKIFLWFKTLHFFIKFNMKISILNLTKKTKVLNITTEKNLLHSSMWTLEATFREVGS